jgi:hypothetical protein
MPPWRIWQARSRNLAKAAKDFGIDLPIQSAATRRASAARRPSATAGQEASLPAAEGIVREIAFAHYSFHKAGSSRCRGHQRCSTANVRRSAARGTRGCSPVQPDAPPQTAALMAFGGDRRSLTVGAGQGSATRAAGAVRAERDRRYRRRRDVRRLLEDAKRGRGADDARRVRPSVAVEPPRAGEEVAVLSSDATALCRKRVPSCLRARSRGRVSARGQGEATDPCAMSSTIGRRSRGAASSSA